MDVGLLLDTGGEFDGLVHRHLFGSSHDDESGALGIAEDVEHPPGLLADEADLHEFVDRLGGGELAHDVAGGRRVDDDEVVVPLFHLPGEFADGDDLPHPGRGGGDEIEEPGQGADAGYQRQFELEAEVLLE